MQGIGDTMHSDVPHEANIIIMEVIKMFVQIRRLLLGC